MNDLLDTLGDTSTERDRGGTVRGLAVGTVTDNKDEEGLGRVRVRLPWFGDTSASYWARIATPMASAGKGVFFLPEVGDEVLLGFEQGDPAHPYILGALWNGEARPPEDNADGNNDPRVIRSRAGSELRFTDADKPSVELRLANGRHLLLDYAGISFADEKGNSVQIDSGSGAITITAKGALNLSADGAVSIDAGRSLSLKANGTLSINGQLVTIN